MMDILLTVAIAAGAVAVACLSIGGALWSAMEYRRRWRLRRDLPAYASRPRDGGGYIIRSSGSIFGTQVIDCRTGEPLPYVTKVSWAVDCSGNPLPKAHVELMCVSVDAYLPEGGIDVTCQSQGDTK